MKLDIGFIGGVVCNSIGVTRHVALRRSTTTSSHDGISHREIRYGQFENADIQIVIL